MIKHIVMWRMNDTENASEKNGNMNAMKEKLEALEKLIDDVSSIEVGLNVSNSERSFDIVLISVFENAEALNKYRVHPEHINVVEFINKVTKDVKAVDYEI